MQITSNLSKHFFHAYSEAKGVALHRSDIIKNKRANAFSYFQLAIMLFFLFFFFSITLLYVGGFCYWFVATVIVFFAFAFLAYTVIRYAATYDYAKKNKFKNTLTITEEGITDESFYGIKIFLNWSKVKAIVIKKYTVTILTDTPCYFYFEKAKKDKVVAEIQKHNKNILIIENVL